LANEGSLFGLLDLKSKKECENPHHGHLKPIRHYFAKPIKGFVSRTKYNIINIDLAYKEIFTHLVPTIFCFGLSTKDHTLLHLKLFNSSCIATTQSGSRSASSTLKGSKEEKMSNVHKNLQHVI
jgi:hypothetical protein